MISFRWSIKYHMFAHKIKIMKTLKTLLLVAILFSINACQKDADKPSNVVPVSNAGNDSVITLPTNTFTLSGSGKDADGSVVAYLWSQVSGPASTIITNPGSPSTLVSGFVAGKYVFQLMVTDNDGATGVDTVSVTVKPSPIITLTLAPAKNPTEYNLVLYNNADQTSTGSVELPVQQWTRGGGPLTFREIIKFDLSSIPANATIVSADLYLYSDTIPQNGNLVDANFGTDNSMLIQQVSDSWSPSTLNWFNQPSTTVNQVIIPSTSSPFLNLDVNVTNMVSSMVANNANYGFKLLLRNETAYNSRIFCSSYYSDASRHPRLVINYKL